MAARATDHAVTSLLTAGARGRCDPNHYLKRNAARKRERETGVLFPIPVEPVSRVSREDRERGLERQPCGRDGRERPAFFLPVELAAGGSVLRAGSPPRFFGKGGVMACDELITLLKDPQVRKALADAINSLAARHAIRGLEPYPRLAPEVVWRL